MGENKLDWIEKVCLRLQQEKTRELDRKDVERCKGKLDLAITRTEHCRIEENTRCARAQ